LEQLLATAAAVQKPAPAPAPIAPTRLLSDDERAEYGDEFLGVVGKKAKEELSPELARLEAEVHTLKQQLTGVGQHMTVTAQEVMYNRLDADVPQWRALNSDAGFNAWLDLPDAYSGAIRRSLLVAAHGRNDATRVAAFFRGYTSDAAVTDPASLSQPARNTSPKVPLESLAAPGRAKTAAVPNTPAEKPIITRAQIQQFYSEVRAGQFDQDPDGKKAIEAAIFAATREGRIK
jgi:hypothetical protein